MTALAGDLALALDATRIAHRAGVQPDAWQADVLRSAAPRVLLNCCRQSGKSTTAASLALHTALYQPGALVLMLSPSQRQSAEIFRKALNLYQKIGRPVMAIQESALKLELAHGSRIVALPGKEQTVRGFSGVNLLVVDEAARVADELYRAVRPMLAVSGGRLVALSTPFGKRGWFYEEWADASGWQQVTVTGRDCPRISAAFMEEERRALGDRWFRQEYLCSFEETEGAVFAMDELRAAMEPWAPPPPGG